jgi:hypothetical protein
VEFIPRRPEARICLYHQFPHLSKKPDYVYIRCANSMSANYIT